MAIKSFHEIKAWEKSHALVFEVYRLTEKYPKTEIFGLTNQTRRCAVSVPSNIVEGYRRKSKNDSLHFYNISQGSLEELRYQLLLAHDLCYVADFEYVIVNTLVEETSKLLNGWVKSQKEL